MRRSGGKRWASYFKFRYFCIIVICLWAGNILFFHPAPSSTKSVDEIFDQPLAIGITSSLRKEAQARREGVRASWLRLVGSKKAKGVFVVGKPECLINGEECDATTISLLEDLKVEMEEYNDILYIESTDAYSGLAKKTFAFHCWAFDHFPNLEYSMKTDDDIFVRLDKIVHELKSMPTSHLYWGFTWKKAPRVDLKTHKNYEPNYEPPEYPSFNSGVANILSKDLVKYIADNRHLLRPLSNEDVTIGTWLSTLNVKPTHDTRFQAHAGMCFEDMFTKHPAKPLDMKMFFDRVNDRLPLCTGFDAYACPYGRECRGNEVDWRQGLHCDAGGCAPLVQSEATTDAEAARARLLMTSSSHAFCEISRDNRSFVTPTLPGNLATNPGFERDASQGFLVSESLFNGWSFFYDGYAVELDPKAARGSHQYKNTSCLYLTSDTFTGEKMYGATQTVKVGQDIPMPILITAWARGKDIIRGNEALPQDISVYMHFTFEDDSRDLEVTLDIAPDSTTWQFYSKVYYPLKPVKEVALSILFSRHKGKIWFDDVQLLSLDTKEAVCAASFVARSVDALVLPTKVKYDGEKLVSPSPNPLFCHSKGPRFILVWTTDEETFKLQHLRVLESIFYHHPDACIRIFTNTLSLLFFSPLAFAGYDVRVLRYDLAQLAEKMPGEGWLQKLDEWKKGAYFYAHSSDFVRFLLLYRFGGIYSDFDSVMVQPLPLEKLSPDFIGVEWCEIEGLAWCIDIKESEFVLPITQPKFTPPTNTFSFSIGLMGFEAGSQFLKEVLQSFVTDYTPTRWGCGTVLSSMAFKNHPSSSSPIKINIVPTHAFYPVGYQDIAKYFLEDDPSFWKEIKKASFAIHLFGKNTGKEPIKSGTLIHTALTEFALSKYIEFS